MAIALKLYPVLFVLAVIPYLARAPQRGQRALHFFSALAVTELASVVAPFLVFRWDIGGFLSVLTDQTVRRPGGISPIGLLPLLINLDIKTWALSACIACLSSLPYG